MKKSYIKRKTRLKSQSRKVRDEIEPRYKRLKEYLVKERHVKGCEQCGKRTPYLECHHIVRRSSDGRIDEPWNLIFLCRECHNETKPDREEKRTTLLELVHQLNDKYLIEEVWSGSKE